MAKCKCCGQEMPRGQRNMPEGVFNTLVFTRSDLESVSVVYPKGHPDYPEGRSVTKIEDLREAIVEDGYWWGRKDIAMVNMKPWDKGQSGAQHCLEPYVNVKDLQRQPAWRYLSPGQKKWCKEECVRLVEAEKTYSLPEGTLINR